MKTEDLPDDVAVAIAKRLKVQFDALETATTLLQAWAPIEAMYEAQKARMSTHEKLRVRRLAERTREAVRNAKTAFTDAEAWLDAWTQEGQARLAEFARLGSQLEPFQASRHREAALPAAKATAQILDEAGEHLVGFTWSGDL